jgi:hypothetical protein
MRVRLTATVGALAVAATSFTAIAAVGPMTPAGAAGPTVKVTPSVNVTRAGRTFLIQGSGFSTTANNGFGVYVTFGPKPSLHPSDWSTNIAYYQASVWVHPTGATNTATNRPMNPDGSFLFTLTNANGSPLTPIYGTTDCTKIPCGVLTMAAHGVPDRSQDSFRPVIFNTPDPTKAKVGVPYATRVAPVGVKPFVWALKSGTLPPGVRLNASSGILSGTPTTEGVYRPTIEATDSTAPTPQEVSRKLLIRVAPKAIVIAPATLPARAAGVAFSRQLTASGGLTPYTFTVHSGAVPPGVTLTAAGKLSGTPTATGSFRFLVRVTDKFAFAGTRTYTLTIT